MRIIPQHSFLGNDSIVGSVVHTIITAIASIQGMAVGIVPVVVCISRTGTAVSLVSTTVGHCACSLYTLSYHHRVRYIPML